MEITGTAADEVGPRIGPQLALSRHAGTDVKITSQVLRTLADRV